MLIEEYNENPDAFIRGNTSKPNIQNKYIYRYISLIRILEILESKVITINAVTTWEDVYENWFLKSGVQINNGNDTTQDLQNRFFGMCWSFQYRSDALWRIYSPYKNGVRIKVKIDNVMRSIIYGIQEDKNLEKCYSGVVDYYSKNELEKIARKQSQALIDRNIKSIAINSLLQKRNEFLHEQEFRFIVLLKKEVKDKKHICIEIEPNELIETIMFDPRIDDTEYDILKSVLRKLDYKGGIYKSKMYTYKIVI